ncbi:hypothetical protein MLD38_034947 [Melastoma candidum]|uniref:Uncharacterized protein n=1 Tax=Melastoma candidum TaxID=119954 RepID=A0ACB9MBA8_9MYRT|nr:hypothetical protein MLD38_034947 [Melastoma candidum]
MNEAGGRNDVDVTVERSTWHVLVVGLGGILSSPHPGLRVRGSISMELRFNGCSHLHYIRAVRYGEVGKVSNMSHGRPALKFKKVCDLYEHDGMRRFHSMVTLLPEEELSDPETRSSEERCRDLESDWSSSGLSSFHIKDETEDQMDDVALDGMTITQMREMFKSKKRKQQNCLDISEKNRFILTVKKEEEEEDELLEPLITLKTKAKDGFVGKGRHVKMNIKTPNNAEVVPSALISCPRPTSRSPSNCKSSIVVKIADEPGLCPADIPCIVGDSDVRIDIMVSDSSEDIKQGVDCHSDRDPGIVYTSLEMPSAVVTNGTCEGASECDSDNEIYACKEAESCVVNEVLHEKIGHDLFLDGNYADFVAVDHVENEEASTSSLLVAGNPTERTGSDHPMDALKICDESSQAVDMKISLECSDLSSEMVYSATLQPNEGVSRDSVIQYVDEIREHLHMSHETIVVTTSCGGSTSSKLEQDIRNNEVQFEDSHETTLSSIHETSFMGVWRRRSSSAEPLPGITVFQDGEVPDEDRVKDDLHSTHEINDRCVSRESSPSQELQLEKQDVQVNEPLVVNRSSEKLQSSQLTNDMGRSREMASLSEHNEPDCQHYEPQFEDSSGESFQSSHKACATEGAALSSHSAEIPIGLASSGFCSPPYASTLDRLSYVIECKGEEKNSSTDGPSNAVTDTTTSTELVNDHRDRRSQQSSGRLFCARKVISPKSQERLRKLLGSAELFDDDKNYPRKKLIFQKLVEAENSGVRIDEVKRAELPSGLNQFQRKRKNQTRRSPRDVFKTSPSSVGTPSVNSIQRFAESAIAFSLRQMQDIDGLASTLMNELNVMKDIIEEHICPGNNIAGAKTCTPNEMKDVIDNATRVQETTRKWLSMMTRDCNRFCKIMRLSDDGSSGSPISEKGSNKERKKIVFADEAGGDLCQVKYIEDMSSTSLEMNLKDEVEE